MKPGELYTNKPDDFTSYLNPARKNDPKFYNMMGFVIIKLIKYLGHDLWEFENIGSASISIVDKNDPSCMHQPISGEQIHKYYVKIGEAGDSKLLKQIEADKKQAELDLDILSPLED